MSRCKDAPCGFECPYRHNCPHLQSLSTTWVMQVYQESFQLQERLHRLEEQSRQRIEELEKTLLERDAKIAQLRLEHQKRFKANAKPASPPIQVKARRRGAPRGHPGWRRRTPDHVDQIIDVAAPQVCPHCECTDLQTCPELHEHLQEDIVLVPRTVVSKYVHRQCICPRCRRAVYQTAPGELRGCDIGPVTRAMIPSLKKRLKRLSSQPLEHEAAQTLRKRVMVKDWDKLFTFLPVKGVEPTNNLSERSLRFLVIMRKICFGTRSAAGSESHSVLPSLLQTARRQGKDAIQFLVTLLTQPTSAAKAALFTGES